MEDGPVLKSDWSRAGFVWICWSCYIPRPNSCGFTDLNALSSDNKSKTIFCETFINIFRKFPEMLGNFFWKSRKLSEIIEKCFIEIPEKHICGEFL